MLHQCGVQTAIITGRDAPSVAVRAKQLGIRHYFKGISDKRAAYAQLREAAGVAEHECAYIGDDVVEFARDGAAAACPLLYLKRTNGCCNTLPTSPAARPAPVPCANCVKSSCRPKAT